MCKIGVHEFSFGVENFELRGGVFMPFISRPCLDWGREKKINCQKDLKDFFLRFHATRSDQEQKILGAVATSIWQRPQLLLTLKKAEFAPHLFCN